METTDYTDLTDGKSIMEICPLASRVSGDISWGLNPKSEVDWKIRAFGTTETLRTTEGTDFAQPDGKRTLSCFNNILSGLSGSQCFSGFSASIRHATSEFGLKSFSVKSVKIRKIRGEISRHTVSHFPFQG